MKRRRLNKAEKELRNILVDSCAAECHDECKTCESADMQMESVLKWCRAHPDFLDWDAEQEYQELLS